MNKHFICIFLDLPVILSQDYCGFLEPQERVWKGESGKGYYLKNLMHNCPEALEPFDGICSFSKHNPSYTNKTLFRFPLRSRESKLSGAVYNIDKLHSLLDTLKDEAQYLLVFLRSVCSIEICKITESNETMSLFKVSVSQRDYQARLSQQRQLVEQVETTFTAQSQYSVCKVIVDMSHFNIEKVDGSICSKYEWLVVNQVGSDSDEVMNLAGKQHILPWVGTAIDLMGSHSNGRIFCVLPLPVEDQAPFCVHINGTFAISSNRRSLKWEAQERKGDEEGTWNKLLIEKCLPSCYVKLVSKLMELNSDPSAVYKCWPDIGRVSGTPWQGLLASFYHLLLRKSKVVHTPLSGGKWISVQDAVFITGNVTEAVRDAVTRCNVNIVEVNDICNQALKHYCISSLTTLQPALVRSYLKRNHQSYSSASRESKFEILRYCLKDNLYYDVCGLYLLPLANGSFQQFQNKTRYVEDTFVCSSSFPCNLLPGLESKLVNVYDEDSPLHSLLCSIANSSHTQLIMLNAPQVANLLSQCNTSSWSHEQMSHFWQWLKNQQLSYFQNKLLVPIKSYSNNATTITPLARQGRAIYISQYTSMPSRDLLTGLEKCGIQFADARKFSYLSHSQLSEYLYQFEHNQVLDALQSLSVANASLSSTEAIALQDFFSNSSFKSSRLSTIAIIPLFKVIQQDKSTRLSINTIRTPYGGNKAIAMDGVYGFKTDILPSSPFVIDASGNVSSLLRNLPNDVSLMTEVDYLQTVVFLQIRNQQFNRSSVVPFMKSVLDNFYIPQYKRVSQKLISVMRSLPFVQVNSATLDAPQNLFDSENATLVELFRGECHRFPASSYQPYLPILRECGLKSSVTANDIYQILKSVWESIWVDSYYQYSYDVGGTGYKRIVSVLKYLVDNSHLFDVSIEYRRTLLNTLRDQADQYCWLPLASNPPSNYPSCLVWKGSQYTGTTLVSTSISPLVVLMEDLSSSVLPQIVGSEAIFVQNIPSQLAQGLGSQPSIMVPAVISHFNQVVSNEDEITEQVLQEVSLQTYTYLQQNIGYCNAKLFSFKWIWSESLSTFIASSEVAVATNPSFRLNLEPFIFVLPSNLQRFSELLTRCGVPATVTASQIISVLQSIKNHSSGSQINKDVAWSIVKAIMEWIADDTGRLNEGNVLVPVESESSYPQLLPIQKVSYTDNEMLRDIANDSDEDYHLIHPQVSHLASVLELTPLSDHLDITQDVFDDAGQHEPLTTRLSNILRDYKDGLTIIKEMIQNADDAGATEVNILYDNRTHPTQNLLFKGMAESHGPALIVHNNSTFTDEDFENITKLAGATKDKQPLKIGKFGVGFCSVYHITDVPSFVSGEWLYIFDPTLKYLKGIVRNVSRPGKKVKYVSKFMVRSQQLTPYEDLFGFTASSHYNGTMFRLPFRANASQISCTLYNNDLVQQMKDDLVKNGSKLLLFLQHVKRITFSSLQGGSTVTEVSINFSSTENGIKTCVTKFPERSSTEYWLVSSVEEKLKTENGSYKLVTASAACKLVKEDSFYKCKAVDGSVFCFLPLSVPNTGLPVHISANFAVMSNRSGIWTEAASGEPSDSREHWNHQVMTTKIPDAYCSLLKKLKNMYVSEKLVSYDFYALWPLQNKLEMKYPWESMIPALYKLISLEKLFYCSSTHQWLTLTESQFLPSSLFEVQDPTCVIEAVDILQLSVIFLPQSHIMELQSPSTITESQFSEAFFTYILSFGQCICTRNKVLKMMLSAIGHGTEVLPKYNQLLNLLMSHACVPTSPKGVELKLANQLVDAENFCDMFDPENEMFPLGIFYEDALVREGIIRLGLISPNNVDWCIIIRSAETVLSLVQCHHKKALKRIKVIIECIEEKKDSAPPELKEISFLPVLPRPDKYFLSWKGDSHCLLPPVQMSVGDNNNLKKASMLLGSQKAIINTKVISSGGCGSISSHVLQLLDVPLKPLFDDVRNHFIHLMDKFDPVMCDDFEKKHLVDEICQLVYAHFEAEVKKTAKKSQKQVPARYNKLLAAYCEKPFVWTGRHFVCPCDTSINWKQPEGPYLYKLPGILSQHESLVKCLEITENFDIEKLLSTLRQMYEDFRPTFKLPEECRETAKNIISELNSSQTEVLECMKENAILFDENYVLRPAKQLAFNDAAWLPPDNESHYVTSILGREKALALGVQPTRSKFLDKYTSAANFIGVPFGQHEELTQRIKNILQDYPLDVTFLKELLQNADDAKASKMRVILDKRQHNAEKVPFNNGQELQGPAILVWDDKDFNDKDLEGIQQLGLGSKRDDDESIGQFGIGFNVVYHVTDCPSFFTKGNTLCVFDPHCKYIFGADVLNPGRQFNTDSVFWDSMSDLCSSFLQDNFPNKPLGLDKGVLFRFPLRCTPEQVKNSKLVDQNKTKPLTVHAVEELLAKWTQEIKQSLIFLNHIVQFEYYVIEESGEIKCQGNYNIHIDEESTEKRTSLNESFAVFRDTKNPILVTYPLVLETMVPSMYSRKEHWLIQQGVGDVENHTKNWSFLNTKALPKHGIAATWERHSDFRGQLFCFLPLPVYTDLPVHINGQFVLVSNRRSLWVSTTEEPDDKTRWNDSLIEAIASSYVQFLKEAKDYYFSHDGFDNRDDIFDSVNKYYSLFPLWNPPFTYEKKKEKPETTYRSAGFTQNSMPSRSYTQLNRTDWKGICSKVFQIMWAKNSKFLAMEMKMKEKSIKDSKTVEWWAITWHEFLNNKDPQRQAYFPSNASMKELKKVLRRLGMILTCAPHALYSHMKFNENKPAILSRKSVYEYYCKFHHKIICKCPCFIDDTGFKSIDGFLTVFKYLLSRSDEEDSVKKYVFPSFPDGIPLLLTADSQLQAFSDPPQVLCSKYLHLFQNSAFMFLHPMVHASQPHLSTSYFVSELSFSAISNILLQNFSSTLESTEVNNTNSVVLSAESLKGLWLCFKNDPVFSKHVSKIVQNWALIPAKSGHLFSAESPVIPILEPTYDTDANVIDLASQLVLLGVPQFDPVYHNSLAKNYCINLTDYNKVLSVLYHVHQKTQVLNYLKNPEKIILILFDYFGRINFKHDKRSLELIKCLPLFKAVNGDLTSLSNKKLYCWPSRACKSGYNKWASSDSVVFLPTNGDWTDLCDSIKILDGQQLTEKDLYMKFIFLKFKLLTAGERMEHMRHIKNTLFSNATYESKHKQCDGYASAMQFLQALKDLPCLETKHGNLQPIKNFSNHNMQIFTTFSAHFDFVPEEYREEEWFEFLKALELQCVVTIADFENFAKLVQSGRHTDVTKASSVLVSYLFSDSSNEWHLKPSCLLKIASIRFVQVIDLKKLEWIRKTCQPPLYLENQMIGLTSLNEAVEYDSASLIWTVRPVVKLPKPQYLNYYSRPNNYHSLLEKLGVTLQPDVKNVLQNLINISQTGLANFDLFHKYNPAYTVKEDTGRVHIEEIIKQSLSYLFKSKANEELHDLSTVSCIPVLASPCQPVLVKPMQVVRYLSDDCSHLFPYLHKLPDFLVNFQNLQDIGISDNITVKSLQYLLEIMHGQLLDNKLDENNKCTVREAVIKMHNLLKDSYNLHKSLIKDISPLFYPNNEGCLIISTNLVFVDSSRYVTKADNKYDFSDMKYSLFHLSHPPRAMPVTHSLSPKIICLQLPKEVRPKGFSLICREELVDDTEATEKNSPLSLHFIGLKSIASALKTILPKIIQANFKDRHVELEESNVNHFATTLVETFITGVKIIVLKNLKSRILVGEKSVATINVEYLFQRDKDSFVLYVDTKTNPSSHSVRKEIAHTLCLETARMHGKELTSYFRFTTVICECLAAQSIGDLLPILERYEVDSSGMELMTEIDSHLVVLGGPISEYCIDILENDINHIFHPEEWVGFLNDQGNFIYAIVCYLVPQEVFNPLQRKYVIMIDESDERKEVSTLDLYKLTKVNSVYSLEEGETCQELIFSDDNSASATLERATDSTSVLDLKKAIIQDLKMIWELKNIDERRKAIKRLWKQYHPDKNLDKNQIYDEAFKFLKRQIERLEQGKPLEDPDALSESSSPSTMSSSRHSNYYSNYWGPFFEEWEDMRSQRRANYTRERAQKRDGRGFMYDIPQPKSDPTEARHWITQAESDLEAMLLLSQQIHYRKRVQCQVLFLAHEVCEKALKAGKYLLVGLNPASLKTHDLYPHACAIAGLKGSEWNELPNLVYAVEPYFLKPRYPNQHHPSSVAPVDVYSNDSKAGDVQKAIKSTQKVMELIQKLFY